MGLKDFVEPGRVCFINYGVDYGKMIVIVDISDDSTVLVDGLKAFPRVVYPLRRLTLTQLRVPILRGARTGTLVKAAAKFGLDEKWAGNKANQKMQRFVKRASLSDLDRFKVMLPGRTRATLSSTPVARSRRPPLPRRERSEQLRIRAKRASRLPERPPRQLPADGARTFRRSFA